jgi:hypothetical protein
VKRIAVLFRETCQALRPPRITLHWCPVARPRSHYLKAALVYRWQKVTVQLVEKQRQRLGRVRSRMRYPRVSAQFLEKFVTNTEPFRQFPTIAPTVHLGPLPRVKHIMIIHALASEAARSSRRGFIPLRGLIPDRAHDIHIQPVPSMPGMSPLRPRGALRLRPHWARLSFSTALLNGLSLIALPTTPAA